MSVRLQMLTKRGGLAFWVILGAMCWTAPLLHAQPHATNAAIITAGGVRGIPGATVSVPLSVSHTGAVSAVQCDLTYNPGRMTAGLLQAGLLSSDQTLRTRQIAPGVHRVLVYQNVPSLLPTNVVLGGLPFSLPSGQLSGGGRITISNAVVSSPNALAVAPVQLRHGGVLVESIYRGSDGVVDLFLIVQSNRTYVVQATTNFSTWINIATNFAAQDYIVVQDASAVDNPLRFYRAVAVDTPGGGMITGPNLLVGDQMVFGYATKAGRTYVLQSSTNLAQWQNQITNQASGTLLNYTNPLSPLIPQQFFRVLELP